MRAEFVGDEGVVVDTLLELLRSLGSRWSAARRLTVYVVLLAVLGVLAAVAGYFVGDIELARVALGSLAGVSWFVAGYLAWFGLIPVKGAAWMNFRARFVLDFRRRVGGGVALFWVALMLLLSRAIHVDGSFFGAATIAVFGALMLLVTATPVERAAIAAALEAEEEANIWAAENPTFDEDGVQVELPVPPEKVSLLRRGLRRLVG